ncbi:MAG: SpoIIE family protein phosphatase [Planctomycetota bacterium]|jgi:serine phosphatase RsbU (regulator of sigma subunit)
MGRAISIRSGLLLSLLIIIVLLGGGILATTFLAARAVVRTLTREVIRQRIDELDGELHRFFDPAHRVLRMAQTWGDAGRLDPDRPEELRALFEPFMRQYRQITSLLVADARGHEYMLLRIGEQWINRQTRRDEWGTRVRWLEWSDDHPEPVASWKEVDYDPRRRPWFEGAVAKAGEISWTRPYTFFTTKEPGITASVTFAAGAGRVGVLGFDVLLKDISRFTRKAFVSAHGTMCVLTDDDRVIGLPGIARFEDSAARTEAYLKSPRELGVPVVTDAVARLPAGERGPVEFESEGELWLGGTKDFWLAGDRKLWIAVMVPLRDLLAGLRELRTWILALTGTVLVLAVWQALVLARRFSRPIEALARNSDRIGRGDLEGGAPVASRVTEMRRLVEAQEQMRVSLQTLLKLERDMQIARQIQQDTFPDLLPELEGFDLAARSEPAEETGGDTYDVVGLGPDGVVARGRARRVVLLLADATGHGIGPALSVTQVRAMLRIALRTGNDLPTLVRQMNEQLCQDLDAMRFITAWFGVLDAADRTLTGFSAGQGPLLHYAAARDAWETLRADAPPLGILRDLAVAVPDPIRLAPGDLFAVLSDGFFEAIAPDGDPFGIERVQRVVAAHREAPAAEILAAVWAAVETFTEGAPATDDRTALLVKAT